jgi:hypothetical protein
VVITNILSNEEQHEAELLMRDDLLDAIDYDKILNNRLNDVIKKIKFSVVKIINTMNSKKKFYVIERYATRKVCIEIAIK